MDAMSVVNQHLHVTVFETVFPLFFTNIGMRVFSFFPFFSKGMYP